MQTLATSDATPFLVAGRTYLPSLSTNGSVLFQASAPCVAVGDSIYIGPLGATVYNCQDDTLVTGTAYAVSMNDSLVATFTGRATADGRIGVYRGSSVLVPDGALLGPGAAIINNSGTVAFVGAVNGEFAIHTTSDGTAFTRISAIDSRLDSEFSFNDAGGIAYKGIDLDGFGAIFVGRDLELDRVIGAGDVLDGSTVSSVTLWPEALNNTGQIAFYAFFTDGRQGVYRAEPTPSCATDISATVEVANQGQLKFNKKTGRYTQTVTLRNSDGAVAGPVSLALDGLSSNATLFGANGVTVCATPAGSPYVNVSIGSDASFGVRERATVTLEFVKPSGQAVTWTSTRVLAGAVK